MKINKFDKKGYTVTLELEEDFSEIEKATDQVFKTEVQKAKIPGFRQGKAPRQVYEKYYGKGALLEKASNQVMNQAYAQAIREKELQPVDYPKKIDVKTFDESKPFVFELQVDVKPEVKLSKYKGLKLTRKKVEVTDQEVDQELEKHQKQMATYEPVESAEKAVVDDLLSYDIEASIDGNPLEALTKQNSGTKLGENMIHEQLDQALQGMKVGEQKSIEVQFDDKAPDESVKGKKVLFQFKINEIRRKQLPKIDDEFAKKISKKETLKELKELVKENLLHERKHKSEQDFEDLLAKELVENNKFEIPESMIQQEVQSFKNRLNQYLQQSKLGFEQYLAMTGKTVEDWEKENKPKAEENVRFSLIIDALVEKESFEVSEEELKAEVQKMIDSVPEDQRKDIKFDQVLDAQRDNLSYHLKRQKAIDLIKKEAKIKEE